MALVCERCGNPIEPGDKFCMYCGNPIKQQPVARQDPRGMSQMAMQNAPSMVDLTSTPRQQPLVNPSVTAGANTGEILCPSCGAKVEPDWVFCLTCGRDISSQIKNQLNQMQNQSNVFAAEKEQQYAGSAISSRSVLMQDFESDTNHSLSSNQFELSSRTEMVSTAPDQESMTTAVGVGTRVSERAGLTGGYSPLFISGDITDQSLVDIDRSKSVSYSDSMKSSINSAYPEDTDCFDMPDVVDVGNAGDDAPTTVYDIYDEDPDAPTMVFEEPVVVLLTRRRTDEKLLLDLPAVVGKGTKSTVRITKNAGISRTHVRIYMENGIYYAEDLESTNGTFINEERIEPSQPRELINGDVLKLADEEFDFIVD